MWSFGGGGLVGIFVVVVGVVFVISGLYLCGLFDVVFGMNWWVYWVVGYVLLMIDVYLLFWFEGGGDDLDWVVAVFVLFELVLLV